MPKLEHSILSGGTEEVRVSVPDDLEGKSAGDIQGRDAAAGAEIGFDGVYRELDVEAVQTHTEPPTDLGIMATATTLAGKPATAEEALAQPEKHLVTIQGMQTTVAAAKASNLIRQFSKSSIVDSDDLLPEPKPAVDHSPILSSAGQQTVRILDKLGGLENFNRLLAHVGTEGKLNIKTDAALSEFSKQCQQPGIEEARAIANSLVVDTVQSLRDSLVEEYGQAGDDAHEFLIRQCTSDAKVEALRACIYGDRTIIKRTMDRHKLGNKGLV